MVGAPRKIKKDAQIQASIKKQKGSESKRGSVREVNVSAS